MAHSTSEGALRKPGTQELNAKSDASYFGEGGEAAAQSDNGSLTTPSLSTGTPSAPSTPSLLSGAYNDSDDLDQIPPLDRLTVFDFLENLALPQRFETLQNSLAAQRDKVRKQQEKLRSSSQKARERVVDELRRRVPPPDDQLQKYRRRMRNSVEQFGTKWNDAKNTTTREKTSFVSSVLNIFLSGYLIGAWPNMFHLWYTAQIAYFYPVRFYLYRKKGYHYFVADLCYYVNLLLLLSIWAFPQSKRLFISTFCLAFGNNAIAIAMWRNSLVFHSFDKVTSLFIHIMPCVTLHVMVHIIPKELQAERFPAIHSIKISSPDSPQHYGLKEMVLWSTVPYALWQLSYHLLITVRRRDAIKAGRPTSFTWLRKSFGHTWLGKLVVSLPENMQEPAFMMIQYSYAILTMLPAPIWFWYRWPSAAFLLFVFTFCVYNGANYYIDIFGKKFQKELEQLKKDVAAWQSSPEIAPRSPMPMGQAGGPGPSGPSGPSGPGDITLGAPAMASPEAVDSEAGGNARTVRGGTDGDGGEETFGDTDGVVKRNSSVSS